MAVPDMAAPIDDVIELTSMRASAMKMSLFSVCTVNVGSAVTYKRFNANFLLFLYLPLFVKV